MCLLGLCVAQRSMGVAGAPLTAAFVLAFSFSVGFLRHGQSQSTLPAANFQLPSRKLGNNVKRQ